MLKSSSPVCKWMFLILSEENVILINFEHQKWVWENVCLIIFVDTYVWFWNGRCYAILLYRQMLLPWQMLLPYDIVADVIALTDVVAIFYCGRCCNHWGRCYILYYSKVADVIAIWCCGRCWNHMSCMLQHVVLAGVFAQWQME